MNLYSVDLLTLSYPRAACMKRFRRMNALAKLFAEIAPCKEPELVVEAVILSVDHAVLVVEKLGLSMDRRGHVQRLMDAIR